MTKRMFILLIALMIAMHICGFTCWEDDGKAIRIETDLNYSGEIVHLSSGGYMILWSDTSGGLQEMKVQKVSSEGEILWGEPVTLAVIACNYADYESLVETANGEVVACWSECGNPGSLRMQRIDENGNLLWGESGVRIELDEDFSECFDTKIVSGGNGAIYAIWWDSENNHDIRGICVNSEGEIVENWSSTGNMLFANTLSPNLFSAVSDGFGGLIVAVRLYSDSFILQRYDTEANCIWSEDGVYISGFEQDSKMSILPWEEGEYAVVIQENEGYRANIIDQNGSFQYGEMQLIASSVEGANCIRFESVRTTDGKLATLWLDQNSDDISLHIQKTGIGEEPDWGAEGILLQSSSSGYVFSLASDENGGLVFSWNERNIEDNEYDYYYEHLNSEGNSLIGAEPFLVSESTNSNENKIFREEENSILFWSRRQEPYDKLVMQVFDNNELPQLGEEGYSIYKVLAGSISNTIIESNGNLSAVIWKDYRGGLIKEYIQLINNDNGELLYDCDGISVILETNVLSYFSNVCISNDCQRICVTQKTYTTIDVGIVQILDLEGNRLLGDNGISLNESNNVYNCSIASIGENDFVIAWLETEGFMEPVTYLKIQKIVDNQFVWESGITLREISGQGMSKVNINYPYISWVETSGCDSELKLTKITEDGSIAPGWDPEGIVVNSLYTPQLVQLYPDDTGISLFWKPISGENLMGQRFNSDGELQWEEGGRIYGEFSYIYDHQLSEGFIYCAGTTENIVSIFDKFTLDGESFWHEPMSFTDIRIEQFDIWEDLIVMYGISNATNELLAFIYDLNGNLVENHPPDGIVVCSVDKDKQIISSICDNNGNSVILWEDGRGGTQFSSHSSIYVQKIDLTFTPAAEDELHDGNLINVSNYPNPFVVGTILECELPRGAENLEIVIYNIKGQKVRNLPAASNKVAWDCLNDQGKPAGAGLYFYRLTGNGIESKTGRMIMLK